MNGFQATLLREAAKRSIAGCFTAFIDREITIPQGARSRASDSHNHLRAFLDDEYARDDLFPRILSEVDDDYLGGSFARHVKVWPLDDIDIFFPLDGTGLVYTSYGQTLPYDVLTDDGSLANPLLADRDRWMRGNSISSRKLIDGFAKVLRRHYPATTRVRRAGEAVNITLSSELGFDVVPSFSLKPRTSTEYPFYLIPDGNDGWLRTNPRIDLLVSTDLQDKNAKTHRPAVKLLKWWSQNRFNNSFSSYYAELAIMRDTCSRNSYGRTDASVSEATAAAFAALSAAAGNGNLSTWISNAPPVEAPALTLAQLIDLSQVVQRAAQAIAWEQAGAPANALQLWREIFGDQFPTQ